ncbi:Ankyrin repeat-containing protein ITN1 [Glycine soja]
MDTVNANPAATSSPSQTQVVVPMASAYFSSPSVELTTSSPQAHVVQMASPQPRHPSRHILEDKREYLEKCIPLYKLALRGDWNAARRMIDADTSLLNAAITKEWGTLLHVVAGTDRVHFVNQLVKLLSPDDLELQNFNGNTAFCYAAAFGNLQIAAMMIKKNACLPKIRGGEGATPLYMAALKGKGDMARHLYDLTSEILEEDEWTTLFFLCIKNGLYDIALKMLKKHSMLALERDENNDTGLHVLARQPGMKTTPFVQLVECLWNKLLQQDYDETELRSFINLPSQITFDATQVGNFRFVATLMRSYPDLLWEMDEKNRSIIHIAVIHRHSSIYSLIHELGSFKDFISTFEDDEGNNILHYAAKLTPPDKLSLISGAALQMTHELRWFEEVKELMLLLDVEKKNVKGKTPREIFAEEHKELLIKAESWTKSTSINCMLVSALITAGVFTATFMIPGGNDKKLGTPNFLHKPAFLAFSLSVACALVSASASILMFLSIYISYAEEECFKLLPKKLLLGMVAQIISIISMMVAFSVAFYMSYSHGSKWVQIFIVTY